VTRNRWFAAAVAAVIALAGAVAVGFEAGRRYPFEFLRPYLPTPSNAFWAASSDIPFVTYEASPLVADGKLLVFGGFSDLDRNVWNTGRVFDPVTRSWSSRAEMPGGRTHVNAVLVGRTVWFAGGFLGQHPGPATDEVLLYDLDGDTWSKGPPLPQKRGSGALFLLDNRLHYAGGYSEDRDTPVPDHWVLDLGAPEASREWRPASPVPLARGHASAATLGGHAYLIGGAVRHDPHQLDIADVHRYDPATDTWTTVAPLPAPRSHAEPSTFTWQGRIYVVGGRQRTIGVEASPDFSVYDPETDSWTAHTSLPLGRLAPVAAAIGDSVWIMGGGDRTSLPTAREAWVGNLRNAWRPGNAMPVALGEVAGGIIGDRLYLLGHDHAGTQSYDLRTGKWDPVPRARRIASGDHHAAEVIDGRLWLFGGLALGSDVTQVYDPGADAWSYGPAMPFPTGSAATALIGGIVYLAGGISGDTSTRQAARLDPATGAWTPIAPMPVARNHVAAATDGSRFWIFGGRGPGSGDRNELANGYADVQVYDPATDSWLLSGRDAGAPPPLPQARGGMGRAAYVDGEFWIFGGETLDGPGATEAGVYNRVDIYSPATRTWRSGPPMPTARHGIFPLVAGSRIYVAGGGIRAASSISGVLEVLETRHVATPAASASGAR
jgi:N-acetylneuraminic acid mutarotase